MIDIKENFSLKNLSTLRLPATARYFAEIKSEEDVEDLPRLFAFIAEKDIPFLMVGGGSNMVFAFDEYPGCVIRMNLK
jgi:UDP-N-acetylmuramate dehydrogenase